MDSGQTDPTIHYQAAGEGVPPIVFIHGFACARGDWDNQMAAFSYRHRTVSLDLRGHGTSPGKPEDCTIAQCGTDVADLVDHLGLNSTVLVGHSLGCRVAVEAASRLRSRVAGVVLIDGSQYTAVMAAALQARFASSCKYAAHVAASFDAMFTTKTDPGMAQSIIDRAARLPHPIGAALLLDCCRYDLACLPDALLSLDVPVLAIQSTGRQEQSRVTLEEGQTTPYLDMLQSSVRRMSTAVIADTGHFPQIDEANRVNHLIKGFLDDIASQLSC